MMIKGHSAGKAYGRTSVAPYVEIWEQPLLSWLIAHAYGFWERHTWKLLRRMEKPHEKIFNRNDDDLYLPLTNRQDIRCDDLMHHKRKTLIILYLNTEQYGIVTGHLPWTSEQRRKAREQASVEDIT